MWIAIAVLVLAVWLPLGRVGRRGPAPFRETGPHWRRNYSRRSFLRLGGGIVAAGVVAYSGADEAVDRWHATQIRSASSDSLARLVKPMGERFWFLAWALLTALDATLRSNAVSRWGRRNFESMVVGLPVLWTVQRGLGSARPVSETADPRWHPLADDRSASGHTFMAAIPWLHLARLTGRRAGRSLATFASTLTGWSRLNDRMHYFSQIGLGYLIAWNAVDAVARNVDPE